MGNVPSEEKPYTIAKDTEFLLIIFIKMLPLTWSQRRWGVSLWLICECPIACIWRGRQPGVQRDLSLHSDCCISNYCVSQVVLSLNVFPNIQKLNSTRTGIVQTQRACWMALSWPIFCSTSVVRHTGALFAKGRSTVWYGAFHFASTPAKKLIKIALIYCHIKNIRPSRFSSTFIPMWFGLRF